MAPCRMYDNKPAAEKDQCIICALRGGWKPCNLSKSSTLVKKAEKWAAKA